MKDGVEALSSSCEVVARGTSVLCQLQSYLCAALPGGQRPGETACDAGHWEKRGARARDEGLTKEHVYYDGREHLRPWDVLATENEAVREEKKDKEGKPERHREWA